MDMSMMENVKNCSKCQGLMEEGFIPDGIGALRASKITEWYEGIAESSIWTGVKVTGTAHYKVRTYRCTKCGYLESYAD